MPRELKKQISIGGLRKIEASCKKIEKLTSLETTSFTMNKEKDEEIKKAISSWMIWFNIEVSNIRNVIEQQ